MANPNPKTSHLDATKWQPGESGNAKGRPNGVPNRKTILEYYLFEADLSELGLMSRKPKWLDRVKPGTVYEAMTAAQAIKSIQGDTFAFNSLNKALGDDDPPALPHNPIAFICEVPLGDNEAESL